MDRKIILVHGIYAKEGESNVWNMKKPLEASTDFQVEVFEYGFVSMLQARFKNPGIAEKLAAAISPGDIVVNHSNGAAVTWMATHKYGARPDGVVMLQPALDEWRMPVCKWAHVYYNKEDSVVWWSSVLLGNVWGKMGKTGYVQPGRETPLKYDVLWQKVDGEERRTVVRQVDTINDAWRLNVRPARGHLAVFQQPDVAAWGAVVGSRIMQTWLNEDSH